MLFLTSRSTLAHVINCLNSLSTLGNLHCVFDVSIIQLRNSVRHKVLLASSHISYLIPTRNINGLARKL